VQCNSVDSEHAVPGLDVVCSHHCEVKKAKRSRKANKPRLKKCSVLSRRRSGIEQRTSGFPSCFQYLSYPQKGSREEDSFEKVEDEEADEDVLYPPTNR
jgi:hypothetical protein